MIKTASILLLLTVFLNAQEAWTSFSLEPEGLSGYKDSNGTIMIQPRFDFAPYKFLNIAGVVEHVNGDFIKFYLFKNGEEVHNKLYFFDNTPDCESEGTIRFQENNLVGVLNKDAKTIIPAIYSALSPIKNHMSMALKNAKKVCHDFSLFSDINRCEHPYFKGGESFLINDKNEIMIEDFPYTHDLNWYDLKITDTNVSYTQRDVFKGVNGKYYAFLNYKKEFSIWLKNTFIPDVIKGEMQQHVFILLPSKTVSSLSSEKNQKRIINIINDMQTHKYNILSNHLTIYDNEDSHLDKYFDTCYRIKKEQYPGFSLVVDYWSTKKEYSQKRLEFFRSETGYKLTSIYSSEP